MAVPWVSDIELPNSIRLVKDAELPHQRLIRCEFKIGLNFVPEYVSDSRSQKLVDGYMSWFDFRGKFPTPPHYRLGKPLGKYWKDYFFLDNDINEFSPRNPLAAIFVYLHLDDYIIGMMALSFTHNSMLDKEPLLYVELLEVNPKFSNEIMSIVTARGFTPKDVGMPNFSISGVGSALIRYAVNLSIFYRYSGRLQLFAIPEAKDFYLALGMEEIPSSKNIMEFTKESAFEYLRI